MSDATPDSTWLNRFEVKRGEVHIAGFSQAASSLIPLLEASDQLREVRFISPVTQDARTGKERFHLAARIIGETRSE